MKIIPNEDRFNEIPDNRDEVIEKGEVEATKEKEKNDDKEKKDDQEVLFIQDLAFTVKISSPGADSFDLQVKLLLYLFKFLIYILLTLIENFHFQVSSMELVQEIHQLLMDREDTCHRTCFSLQLDGNTLDNFAELKSVEGLREGSVIKVRMLIFQNANKSCLPFKRFLDFY